MQDKENKINPSDQDKIEGQKQDWDIEKLSNEASQKDADEIQRQTLRGDETKGNPDNRDHAGSPESKDTPQGREEAKNDVGGKANANG